MGCSPARQMNSPIIVSSSATNHIIDSKITRVDHRVLSEKFSPVKQENPRAQLETIEAPDILAFDPRHGLRKEFEVSGIPHYSTDNVSLNGKWVYVESFDSVQNEVAFQREIQHKIEKSFITGALRCDLELYGHFAEIIFKDMTVQGDKTLDSGKKEHFSFTVKRSALRREAYGWAAEDGVIRPIVREIEDMLNFTTGVYTYRFDSAILTIDLAKKALIDTQTAFARPLLKL